MPALFALARSAFQRQFAYRAANLAGLITNLFFGLLRAAVVIALFEARGNAPVAGYGLRESVTFMGVAQALIGWVALWGWWDLLRSVKTGEIANDLQRPVDFFWYWAAQDFGRAVSQLLMRGIPLLLAFGFAYPIVLPANAGQTALLALSLGLAWFCSFAWRFMFSLVAFWTTDAMGVARIAIFVQMFLAGFFLPITFFPDAISAAIRLSPFPGMINTPIEIFVNVSRGMDALTAIALQVFWAAALYLGARLALASGIRRLTIQGG